MWCKSSEDKVFTEACVPTGMKTGVFTSPWGVFITPARAWQFLSLLINLNSKFSNLLSRDIETQETIVV